MDVPCIDPRDLMVSLVQKGSTDCDTPQTMDFNSICLDPNYYSDPPLPDARQAIFAGPYLDMQPGDVHLSGFRQENLDQSYVPMESPCMYPTLRTYAEDSLTRFQMPLKAISCKGFWPTRRLHSLHSRQLALNLAS